jgi:serine/threonine protein kinase
MMQLVNGLIELFEKNVVHHDIKPENILLNLCYDEDNPKKKKILKEIKNLLKNKKNKYFLKCLI